MPRGGVEEGRGGGARRAACGGGPRAARCRGVRRGGGRGWRSGVEEGGDERRRGTAATSSGGGDEKFGQHLPCNWLLPARVDVFGGEEKGRFINGGKSSVPGRGIARDL